MHSIIIDSVGYRKDEVQEFLVKELNCTEKEAFRYVNVSPAEIVVDVTKSEAESIKDKLTELGAKVKIADPFITNGGISQGNSNYTESKDRDNLGSVIGKLIIFCSILGGIILYMANEGQYIILAIGVSLSGVLSGIFFLLLGKIIELLEDIKDKLK